jgi:hypothetical protein
MPYLLVRHKVEDYERWKPVFDHDHGATREQWGSKGDGSYATPTTPTLVSSQTSMSCGRRCSGQGLPISRMSTSWKR